LISNYVVYFEFILQFTLGYNTRIFAMVKLVLQFHIQYAQN